MTLCKLCNVEVKVSDAVSIKNNLAYHTECWGSYQTEMDKILKMDKAELEKYKVERLAFL